jgi:hypothetical protein
LSHPQQQQQEVHMTREYTTSFPQANLAMDQASFVEQQPPTLLVVDDDPRQPLHLRQQYKDGFHPASEVVSSNYHPNLMWMPSG